MGWSVKDETVCTVFKRATGGCKQKRGYLFGKGLLQLCKQLAMLGVCEGWQGGCFHGEVAVDTWPIR